jgi:hypothetical protein
VTSCARRHLSTLIGLAGAPSALITRLADDADQPWEAYLLDDDAVDASIAGGR